jgi:hypothetical protein
VGHLTATLRTAKLKGKVGKGITVYSNDPVKSTLRLSVRAIVMASVVVLPREYIMIGGPPTRRGQSKVLVRQDPMETGKLNITDLKTSLPWLKAEATRLKNERPPSDGLPRGQKGDYLVEVSIDGKPEGHAGRARAELTFKTGLKRQPEVAIPITVDLRPPVTLSTGKLMLAPPAEGEVTESTVLVTLRPGLDPNRLEAVASPESLKVELKPSGPRRFKAHVSWDGGKLEQGEITFKVGVERHKLPVHPAAAGS